MTDLLEILHSYLTDGITVSTLLAVYLAWRKIQEAKQKKAAHERMDNKQKAIMIHLGVPWDWDAERKFSRRDTGKTLYEMLPAVKYRVHIVLSFILRMVIGLYESRRGRKMQISKAWLSGLIAAIVGNIALRYGFTFENEWADLAAEIIIQYVLPLITAWLNRKKEVKPDESGYTTESFK